MKQSSLILPNPLGFYTLTKFMVNNFGGVNFLL
jgi:hypothetical protein